MYCKNVLLNIVWEERSATGTDLDGTRDSHSRLLSYRYVTEVITFTKHPTSQPIPWLYSMSIWDLSYFNCSGLSVPELTVCSLNVSWVVFIRAHRSETFCNGEKNPWVSQTSSCSPSRFSVRSVPTEHDPGTYEVSNGLRLWLTA